MNIPHHRFSFHRGLVSPLAWLLAPLVLGFILAARSACQPAASSDAGDLYLNPFNKDSAHHRPIGSDAIYASDDDPATKDWLTMETININSKNGFGDCIAQATTTDPTVTVTFKPTRRGTGGAGLPVTMKMPVGFNGGTTTDAAADVYDATTGLLHEFYILHLTDGQYTAASRLEIDIRGLGHTPPGKKAHVGVTASGMSIFHGLLRSEEINQPGFPMRHVLNFVLPSRPGIDRASMLSKEVVWPASSRDGFAGDPKYNLGHIPYGGLLAILPESKGGPNLDALGLTEPGRRIAQALRDYGAYAMDTGKSPVIRADQFVDDDLRKQLQADLQKVYKYIRLVKNNAPDQNASGGGTPLAPNTAFDAP